MTIHSIVAPSCEELVSGYIPYPTHRRQDRDTRGGPGFGMLVFLGLLALVAAVRLPGAAPTGEGSHLFRASATSRGAIECDPICPASTTPNAEPTGE